MKFRTFLHLVCSFFLASSQFSYAERLLVKKNGEWFVKTGTVQQFTSDPNVEWVERDFIYQTDSEKKQNPNLLPNDPAVKDQWSLEKTEVFSALDLLDSLSETRSEPVVVAVVDTGINAQHLDLNSQIFTNEKEIPNNGIDDDQNGFIDDVHGYNFAARPGEDDHNDEDPTQPIDDDLHGTHVAGIIGAIQNNQLGMAGIAPRVKILPIRWMIKGSGWGSDAIASIRYAVKMGAKIINASWGGIGYSKALEEAIREAESKGVLFVASAGNFKGDNDTTPRHPANFRFSNVISVADTNEKDQLAKSSNFGKTMVEFGAPGEEILSTVLRQGYAKLSGTSMSAAHVSGVAALLMAANPDLKAQEVKKILMDTVIPVAALQGKTITGGRINALAALKKVLQQKTSTPFYEFGEVEVRKMNEAGFIRPDRIEEGAAVQGMSLQLVRLDHGRETPVEGIKFRAQIQGAGTQYQTFETDQEGKVFSQTCQKGSFSVTIALDSPRFSVTPGSQPYDLILNLKCGTHQKVIFEEKSNAGEIIGIWQVLKGAEKKIASEIGIDFWKNQIPFVWPSRGDYYDGMAVHLTYGHQWDVVSHEMGHAIYDQGRIGVFGGGEHYIDRCYENDIALSEGWASFYGAWLNFDLRDADPGFEYMVPRRAPIKIENIPADVCGKPTNEWRVTGFLWDLIDQHEDQEKENQLFSLLWRDTKGLRASSLSVLKSNLMTRGWNAQELEAIWKLNFPDE